MLVAMLVFGVLTIASAIGVVAFPKPLHSALSLVATLFFVAVHFLLLGAEFLATLQILVYAGAIMILVVFVIMLLGLDVQSKNNFSGINSMLALLFCLFFSVLTIFIVTNDKKLVAEGKSYTAVFSESVVQKELSKEDATVEKVGELLFSKYLYPFEVASILLLVAIIGAVVLAQEKKRGIPKGHGLKAKQQIS